MAARQHTLSNNKQALRTGVLVIGGGPAAAWAALTAAEAGAEVTLVDKGYLGTSGATAPSSTGTWCVPPGEGRRLTVEKQLTASLGLGDELWMYRTLDMSFANLVRLSELGFPFPRKDDGTVYMTHLRGMDYMRFMRREVLKRRVKVFDHHPALELLADADGRVIGAAGVERHSGDVWQIMAGAVVLASGGCAFRERILGGTGMTGEGYLMAAEAGALMSGMEFTGKYTLAPLGSSLNKGVAFQYANFYNQDGSSIEAANSPGLAGDERDAEVARALLAGPVFARIERLNDYRQKWFRIAQPNCFLPYDRIGVDPFQDLVPVTMRYEGTVRGTGGVHVVNDECWTGVPGLYVAGDAASRENLSGGVSGGGAINASWAIASGAWAGKGAAKTAAAAKNADGREIPLGKAGLRPDVAGSLNQEEILAGVRAELVPLDRSFFRTGATLRNSLGVFDDLWAHIRERGGQLPAERFRHRELAGMVAVGRWITRAALARQETRGLHRRQDAPQHLRTPARLLLSGEDGQFVAPLSRSAAS
ncbi:FAD-binding protein [Aureimonas fodinaquatilis]|uniref:FAD-binding protein n=1 Tax=Aureimonas fodinaquatilis TaxID=2565783 RepID=A0A5B0DZD2_9HYPH|nr:FAD-binding protein [Aureimonas fodinaquatilis]KAA0971111.1 FAD-binding protein [Aureimonas fodinaquatilis]